MRVAVTIIVAVALVSGIVLASPGLAAYAATLSSAKVFATDDKVSATSTTYIFAFKTATTGSIKRIEITAPTGYGVAGATLTGGSILLQLGTLTVSGQTMQLTLPAAVPLSSGSQLSLQISGIDNPSAVGPHTFDFATKKSSGSTIDSGSASITLTTSDAAPDSVGTDQIQDGAITFDKLAADVLSYITGLIDSLRTELLGLINNESTERQAADDNLQDQIDDLTARVEALEGGGGGGGSIDPDAFEPNDSLDAAEFIGSTSEAETANPIQINANMHTTSDEDWYTANVNEEDNNLAGDDLDIVVSLTNIPVGSNYDLFVTCNHPACFVIDDSTVVSGNSAESITLQVEDELGSDDSVELQIEVRNVSDTASNDDYTLNITVT